MDVEEAKLINRGMRNKRKKQVVHMTANRHNKKAGKESNKRG